MYNVHDHYKALSVDELKIVSRRDRLPYSIMLMNFEHDLNIGNCIRTAHILGAESVIIFGKNKIDSRSTVGAHNYIDMIKVPVDCTQEGVVEKEFEGVLARLRMFPVFIEKTDNSYDIDSKSFDTTINMKMTSYSGYHPCLIFGNESTGIHPDIKLGATFHIKQYGVIRSLNVASAAAIAMFRVTQVLTKIVF